MDMSIGMKTENEAICTLFLALTIMDLLALFFVIFVIMEHICEYDDLYDRNNKQIDLSGVDISNNGIELIDREFISTIENRTPNACVTDAIYAMETLDKIEEICTVTENKAALILSAHRRFRLALWWRHCFASKAWLSNYNSLYVIAGERSASFETSRE